MLRDCMNRFGFIFFKKAKASSFGAGAFCSRAGDLWEDVGDGVLSWGNPKRALRPIRSQQLAQEWLMRHGQGQK